MFSNERTKVLQDLKFGNMGHPSGRSYFSFDNNLAPAIAVCKLKNVNVKLSMRTFSGVSPCRLTSLRLVATSRPSDLNISRRFI